MAQGDVLYQEHGLLPVAHFDLDETQSDSQRVTKEGQIAWSRDGFGAMRLFTYRKNVSASAFAVGDLTSREREVETNITAGSTTSATGTFDATEYTGGLLIVNDNDDVAGGAPEGECSIIIASSATVITLDPNLPLSVALAANDDISLLSPKLIDAADGDFDFMVCGIAMAAVADDGWGWFQFQGIHPAASHKANTAATVGEPIVADAATVNIWGSDAATLWVGRQISVHAADVGSTGDKSPVLMSLLPVYW